MSGERDRTVRDGAVQTTDGPSGSWSGPSRWTRGRAPAAVPGQLLAGARPAAAHDRPPARRGRRRGEASLRAELGRVRDDLQTTIEALQATNEELKASNEEVTSVNEELQSTNEELETSKEELQSLNEELTTVNAQLQAKMEELLATTNDLSSLLSSTNIAVVFLDPQFRIRRFTPAVRDLMDLIAADVGRPLQDMARKFADPDLLADAAAVLERLVPIEREVASESRPVVRPPGPAVPDGRRPHQRRRADVRRHHPAAAGASRTCRCRTSGSGWPSRRPAWASGS